MKLIRYIFKNFQKINLIQNSSYKNIIALKKFLKNNILLVI